jgi:hypothetical protein
MYVQSNNDARSRNNCCHGEAKTLHRCLTVDLPVAVNNTKPLSVATETQEWVPFALLSNYRTLGVTVNNKNLIRSSYGMPEIVVMC